MHAPTTLNRVLPVAFAILSSLHLCAGPSSFTARVTTQDAQPVQAASVQAFNYLPDGSGIDPSPGPRTTTGSNGVFTLQSPPTTALILIQKPGLAPTWTQPHAIQDDDTSLVLSHPATLTGTVVDASTNPVANAEVSVAFASLPAHRPARFNGFSFLFGGPARDLYHTRTGPDGRFSIGGFPTNGAAALLASAPGLSQRPIPIDTSHLPHRPGMDDIRLVLEPSGAILGRILPPTGVPSPPIARIQFTSVNNAFTTPATTDPILSRPDGTFALTNLAATTYRLSAVFGTNSPPDFVAEPVTATVQSGRTTTNISLQAIRGGIINATALNKTTRTPVSNVTVYAFREDFGSQPVTAPSGRAQLRVIPGNVSFHAQAEGFTANQVSLNVEPDSTNEVELELTGPTTVSGTALLPNGAPATNLPVRLIGSMHLATATMALTDSQGAFTLTFNVYSQQERQSVAILIRDPDRHLAAALDLDPEDPPAPVLLRLAPAITLAGRAECNGQPVTNASATLVFWHGNSGAHLPEFTTTNSQPGHFEIRSLPPARRYHIFVSAPGFGQTPLTEIHFPESNTNLLTLDSFELRPANLKLSGQVLDQADKPVAGASVNIHGENQPSAHTSTDQDGRFAFNEVCEGTAQLFAHGNGASGNVTAQGGDTNIIVQLGQSRSVSSGSTQRKLTGTVTLPDGQPAPNVSLSVFPHSEARQKSDANGAFSITINLQEWQMNSGGDPWLVAELASSNLVAAVTLADDVTNLNVQLGPGFSVTGRVQDPNDRPLPKAEIGVWILASRTYSQLFPKLVSPDPQGFFTISNLSSGPQFTIYAQAPGRGRHQQNLSYDNTTNSFILEPIVLKPADQPLAGLVLDDRERPVSGAQVFVTGDGQPQSNATTDSKGRFSFRVCEGELQIHVNARSSYANVTAQAGDTNITVTLDNNSSGTPTPSRPSLKGRPLPDLDTLNLPTTTRPKDQHLLLCLVDIEQRPSRRALSLLAAQADDLESRRITLAAAQASPIATDAFNEWQSNSALSLPMGRCTEPNTTNRWATATPSLPWLILVAPNGTVLDEGFALEDTDAKIQSLTPSP